MGLKTIASESDSWEFFPGRVENKYISSMVVGEWFIHESQEVNVWFYVRCTAYGNCAKRLL